MSDDKRAIKGPLRTVVSVLLLVVLASTITVVTMRISEQGKRIAVQVTAESGVIRVAGAQGLPDAVNWVCDGLDPSILVVESRDLRNEHWDEAVTKLMPGAKLIRTWTTTHTMQASTVKSSGEVLRKVQAVRARLEIETASGVVQPALGISASVAPDGADLTTSYLTIIQLIGDDGEAKIIDGNPLFNQKPVSWAERARGLPAHLVRFELEIVDPVEAEELDDEAKAEAEKIAREAIERLKQNRPERGVIPGAPKAPTPPPTGEGG